MVVSVYKRADGANNKRFGDGEIAKKSGVGYNPAVVAKGFTEAQAGSVRSKKHRNDWALQDVASKVEARF